MQAPTSFLNRTEMIESLAQAYADAVRHGADMREACDVLEAARAALCDPDVFRAWAQLDFQVGRAESDRLRPIVSQFRNRFEKAVQERTCAELGNAFGLGASAGWDYFFTTYIRCFDLRGWRLSLCRALCEQIRGYSPPGRFNSEQIATFTRFMEHGRWAETGEWFAFLAEKAGSPVLRARFLVSEGEIELFHHLQAQRARQLFEEASRLEPEGVRTFTGWSEYWARAEDFAQARKAAEEAIRVAPDLQDGYVALAEIYERQQDFSGAQDAYERGIRADPGTVNAYRGLLQLWGRVELFADRRERLVALSKQICSLGTEVVYLTHLDLGDSYLQNKLRPEAHAEYSQAIALEPERLGAYCSDGYVWLDETYETNHDKSRDPELFSQARQCFQTAIQKAPEALDGYWGMSWVAQQQEQWAEALSWCKESLSRRPQWEVTIRNRMGELHRKLGDLEGAEKELFRVLELEPDNKQALSTLDDLGDDSYLKDTRPDNALRLYAEVRNRRGEGFEADYQNRVGNLYYHVGDFRQAAEAYRKAIAAKADEPVYHSNLALALEQLKTPGSIHEELAAAIEALATAAKLAPDTAAYPQRSAALQIRLDVIARYGEPVLTWTPALLPIRVYVCPRWGSLLLTPDAKSLAANTLEAINNLRARIRKDFGLNLPGIRFGYYDSTSPSSGDFTLNILEGRIVEDGSLPLVQSSDEARFNFFFDALAAFLEKNLHVLATYDDAFNLLPEPARAEASVKSILALLYRWREHLKAGGKLESFDIQTAAAPFPGLEDLRASDLPPPASDAPLQTDPSLVLRVSTQTVLRQERFQELMPSAQEQVFQRSGLIVPLVELHRDATLAPHDFALQISGNQVEADSVLNLDTPRFADSESAVMDRIVQVILEQQPEFISETLAGYYMSSVLSTCPRLVLDTRKLLSNAALAGMLKTRLKAGGSLRHFPELLEMVLRDKLSANPVTSATAAIPSPV